MWHLLFCSLVAISFFWSENSYSIVVVAPTVLCCFELLFNNFHICYVVLIWQLGQSFTKSFSPCWLGACMGNSWSKVPRKFATNQNLRLCVHSSKRKMCGRILDMNHQFYMALCCLGWSSRTLECSLVDFKLWNWASSECKQKSYTLMPPCPTCAWHWQIADLLMYTCFFLRFKHMTRNISLAL